jgi:hypothetical protein
MSTAARRAAPKVDQSERAWWIRTALVLESPRAVFAALRDDSDDAAAARAEPIMALVILGGIAAVLASPETGKLMDDPLIDAANASIIIFLSGGLYGLFVYWLGGGILQLASERLGSLGSYRRSRHVLAYAAVPLVLSLAAVWPVRIAIYGGDVFETGGGDTGAGDQVFTALVLGSAAWSAFLVVAGVRAVHGWSWRRAAAASSLGVGLAVLLVGVVALGLRGA